MNHQGPTADRAPTPDEHEVRQLLALAGTGAPPTDSERYRIAEAMWATLGQHTAGNRPTPQPVVATADQPHPADEHGERRHQRTKRVLLWAAMLLVAAGTVGLVRTTTDQAPNPTNPTETNRTTLRIGDTNMTFDTATGYHVETRAQATLILVADQANLRTHERITIAQADELFDGQDPDEFFAGIGLLAEPAASPKGSTAWLVSVDTTTPECGPGEPCMTIATIVGGEPLELVGGTYARIEVYDNDDRQPVVVVSEVGTPTNGPALLNVELKQ